MDFGLSMAKADDVDLMVQAENLGYSHAWVAGSQMIWPDCHATLALATQRTSAIRLGCLRQKLHTEELARTYRQRVFVRGASCWYCQVGGTRLPVCPGSWDDHLVW